MVFFKETVFYGLLLTLIITVHGFKENPKDQTSTRANTLYDDADDIQRQLNNEAHDKLLTYGKMPACQKAWYMNSLNSSNYTFDKRLRLRISCTIGPLAGQAWRTAVTSNGSTKYQLAALDAVHQARRLIGEDSNEETSDTSFYLSMNTNPNTVWVLHFPTEVPHGNSKPWSRRSRNFKLFQQIKTTTTKQLHTINDVAKDNSLKQVKHWSYKDQPNWYKQYPGCGGHSQSPVDLPAVGLIKTKGCRQLTFLNHDIEPKSLTLKNNAKRLILYGEWECERQPVVYGGAAHSRRYLFHSITLRWPSEHRIGGLQYPLESQVIHISAEYKSLNNTINATPRDAQAILGIVNLYKYSNETHQGLEELIHVATHSRNIDARLPPKPLAYFNPPLKEYVSYQGSLTMPPCSENVLWLVRARALSVSRKMVDVVFNFIGEGELRGSFIRQPQPLNDRKVYLFD